MGKGRHVFWKSVLRRRGSLLLFLALLAAASFGFMLRAVEYLSVTGEIARISENYRPIGMLSFVEEGAEGSDFGSDQLTRAAELLRESPYVEFVDEKRYASAVLSDLYNADIDGWTSSRKDGGKLGTTLGLRTNNILVWATVEDVKNTTTPGRFRYGFRVKEAVYGYPDYFEERNKLVAYLDSMAVNGQSEPVMEEGRTYLFKGNYVPSGNAVYGNVLLFEMLPLAENLWFLEGEPGDDIQQYVDEEDAVCQERNRHSMYATTTADMSSLPQAQDSVMMIMLEDGRLLNHEDNENARPVCVVAKAFAETRGLQVGDTLRLELLDWLSSDSFYGYVTDADGDGWKSCDRVETELEIVGIYSFYYGELEFYHSIGFESCQFFIPDTLLPEQYVQGQRKWSDTFSFVLTSPQVQDAFVQELGEELGALGLSCEFVENSWEAYYRSAEEIAENARNSLAIFAAVIVFALIAVAFLYLWQRRREIAVSRSLGVPARHAAFWACAPMLLLGMAGILAGCVGAWSYGKKQAEQTLAALAAGGHVELAPHWFAAIFLLQWLALSLVLLASGFFYAKKPVLELLQGNAARAGRKKKRPGEALTEDLAARRVADGKAAAGTEVCGVSAHSIVETEECGCTGEDRQAVEALAYAQEKEAAFRITELPETAGAGGRGSVKAAMAGFLWHHLARFSFRLACAVLSAAVFVAAIGWLRQSIADSERELDELYRNTVVEAGITKADTKVFVVLPDEAGAYIYPQTVQRLMDTGFIRDAYLEAGSTNRMGKDMSTGMKKMTFLGFADVEQFLAKDWYSKPKIHYVDGYDGTLFEQKCVLDEMGGLTNEMAVILPQKIWEKWELQPGDVLTAFDSSDHDSVNVVAGGYYEGDLDSIYTDVVLVPADLQNLLELNLNYVTAKFTIDPERNRGLEEFFELAQRVVEEPGAGRVELAFVVWDSELRQVAEPMEKNIDLMKLLYPIVNTVAFLAAAALAVLLLFQRRREAAILRVMGVGKTPVRIALALELAVVNLAGVLLGVLLAAVLPGASVPAAAGVVYFAGGLLGAVAGCVLDTRARPLELLQVKE